PFGMRTSARSNGCRFDRSSDSGSRPSAIEIFFENRPNLPFGDFRSCSRISFRLTLRITVEFCTCALGVLMSNAWQPLLCESLYFGDVVWVFHNVKDIER